MLGWTTIAALAGSPGDEVYLLAHDAWEEGDWSVALDGARAALALDPDHAPARLLEGFALVRLGKAKDGIAILDALVTDPVVAADDPEVTALAEFVIRRFADRWSRDGWSISAGPCFRDSRADTYVVWAAGICGELSLPVSDAFGFRADVTTPFYASDSLALTGPQWSALAVLHHPLGVGTWHVDAAAGPSIWTGRSNYWDHRFRGVFPGGRGAAALDVRPWQVLGFRLEAGYTVHYGAREGLDLWSHGADLRLLTTGYGQ